MPETISHLDELRQESEDSEPIADAIDEDNIDLIRNCDGNCSDCPRINTCDNEREV